MNKMFTVGALITGVAFVSTTFAAWPNFSTNVLPWMSSNGLTKYTTSTEFRADDQIVRGEAAKFVAAFGASLNLTNSYTACKFTDIAGYDSTLTPHIKQACMYGLLKGSQGLFMPNAPLTEAQALAIVIRSVDGFQDETLQPWYSAYFTKAKARGFITTETLASINTTNVTREKLGTWFYLSTEAGMKMMNDDMENDDMMDDQMMDDEMEEEDMMKDDTMMNTAGVYTDYSADMVKTALAEGKKVALFFHANRCPSCIQASKDLMAATLPDNSIVFKVDYDTMTDLKKQYGVTSQHTFVFLASDMSATQVKLGLSAEEVITLLE